MSLHRYPPASVYADYARAGMGLLMTVTPLIFLDLSRWVAVPLAACGLLFLAFAVKALLRHLSSIEVTDEAIARHGPFSRSIRWDKLSAMKLSYYATRRERGSGWMQLLLKGAGTRINVESTLEGFDGVAERAADAARQNGVALDTRTVTNLEAMGIEVPAEETSEDSIIGRS
jgi:hypothetical protein